MGNNYQFSGMPTRLRWVIQFCPQSTLPLGASNCLTLIQQNELTDIKENKDRVVCHKFGWISPHFNSPIQNYDILTIF